jgi:AcrR family transcriptional regulator
MTDTRQKILDSAERLIAENGYSATSLRQIIGEAGVNLASVHYHFGSKEELLNELVKRKAEPVNQERLALLDSYIKDAQGAPIPMEKLLRAFLSPMGRKANDNPQFVRVMGRIMVEGLLPAVVQKNFQPVLTRFTSAMRQSLPHLSDEEFEWRVHFMIGAMAHTMCGVPHGDFEARLERLVVFLSAGFRAPVSGDVRHTEEVERCV